MFRTLLHGGRMNHFIAPSFRRISTRATSREHPPQSGYDEFRDQAQDLRASYRSIQRMDAPYSITISAFVKKCIDMYRCGWSPALLSSSLTDASTELTVPTGHLDLFLESIALVWLTLDLLESKYNISTGRFSFAVASSGLGGAARSSVGAAEGPIYMEAMRGFATMIVDGYLVRRYAWFPLDKLGMELSLTSGTSYPPHVIAELSRIVYSTLSQTVNQFNEEGD